MCNGSRKYAINHIFLGKRTNYTKKSKNKEMLSAAITPVRL